MYPTNQTTYAHTQEQDTGCPAYENWGKIFNGIPTHPTHAMSKITYI